MSFYKVKHLKVAHSEVRIDNKGYIKLPLTNIGLYDANNIDKTDKNIIEVFLEKNKTDQLNIDSGSLKNFLEKEFKSYELYRVYDDINKLIGLYLRGIDN